VQYVDENTFNVFFRDENEALIPITLDAEVHMSTEKENQLVIRDDSHTYLVDFFCDPTTGEVTQLDYEGSPLKAQVKRHSLLRNDGEDETVAADHVKSPMPGTVVKVFCKVGDAATKGQALASIESMKMEYVIRATHDCTVSQVDISEGQFVQMKQKLISFE
jgi:biotin carboxyl carrier protein